MCLKANVSHFARGQEHRNLHKLLWPEQTSGLSHFCNKNFPAKPAVVISALSTGGSVAASLRPERLQASGVALTLQTRLIFFAPVDSRPRTCLCQEMPEV